MKLLYKYYSNESDYAFNNLENGNICFSPLESLNDPFEGVGAYLYQVSDEEQLCWDSIGSDLRKLASNKISNVTRNVSNFKYRVFCSSKNYDNCLLWAYYANSHKGFCVGYEESNILEISDEIIDVEYQSEMCSFNEINENTYRKLLTIKSVDWSVENERRALYELKISDVSSVNPDVYFSSDGQSKEKIYIPHNHIPTNSVEFLCADKFILKECKPSVIYLGLRMECSDKQRLINIAQKNNIQVYQMSQEQNSFKFLPQEIDVYN